VSVMENYYWLASVQYFSVSPPGWHSSPRYLRLFKVQLLGYQMSHIPR
jgi:hypothetical protein